MDDPFLSPRRGGGDTSGSSSNVPLDLDAPPILTRATTSPAQLKRTLQAHLAETRKRLEGAGQLGKDLVKQEEEIESRLRELEESGGKIDPELKRKLAELEKEYNEVGRETTRAMLTNRVVAGQGNGNVSVF
jgi:chromosome segregation ATPase